MKVVVDTNVIVSAALSPGVCRRVIEFVTDDPQITWLVTKEIMAEYFEVLARPKFRIPTAILNRWAQLIGQTTTSITPAIQSLHALRDPKDRMFIECALTGNADYLISGDQHLHEAKLQNGALVLHPGTFERYVVNS